MLASLSDMVRKDGNFTDLGLVAEDYETAEAVIDLLLRHPDLMQRPIAVKDGKAVIARPADRVLELLE